MNLINIINIIILLVWRSGKRLPSTFKGPGFNSSWLQFGRNNNNLKL